MGYHTNLPFAGVSAKLVSGRGSVTFINFSETTAAAAAAVDLWDGSDTGGVYLGQIRLVEGTCLVSAPGPGRLVFTRGIYVHVLTGTLVGNIGVRLLPSDAEWQAAQAAWDQAS